MEKYPDFWQVVLGPGPVGFFLGFTVVAFICAFVSLLLDTSSRDVASKNTPVHFSWNFLLAANWKRIIANVLSIPILIRLFYPNFSLEVMLGIAIGVGFAADRAAMWLRNIGALSSNKAANRVNADMAADQPTVTPKPVEKLPS